MVRGRAIVLNHRSDGGVWRVLPLGAHELLVCRRSFSYPDEGLSWTSSDRYGRVLSFTVIVFNYTVTGTTI